jgi:hypothetical protein
LRRFQKACADSLDEALVMARVMSVGAVGSGSGLNRLTDDCDLRN